MFTLAINFITVLQLTMSKCHWFLNSRKQILVLLWIQPSGKSRVLLCMYSPNSWCFAFLLKVQIFSVQGCNVNNLLDNNRKATYFKCKSYTLVTVVLMTSSVSLWNNLVDWSKSSDNFAVSFSHLVLSVIWGNCKLVLHGEVSGNLF